ncbi:MAG: disulfide bond formation protein B [Candidatus Dormibacteria bacterium]|jgi:disulfide bond formation protein DsbB
MTLLGVATPLAVLALVADAIVLLALLGFLVSRVSASARGWWDSLRDLVSPLGLPAAFLVSLIAVSGSLYFQFGADLVPCQLCWFQRICMYPMVVLLGISAVRRDLFNARLYALPLGVVGLGLSIYHYLLERFPGQIHLNCGVGQPDCAVTPFDIFGFVSIPYMALAAFLLILTLLLFARDAGQEWEEGAAPS